jgi:glycosyltransferase involved in cell wall biosynthesis
MKVLYFHQHFSTPAGSAGIRSYEMARALVARGHEVLMVCGSYSGGHTGLEQPYRNGMRHGRVDGIDIVEFDLAYANADGFLRRVLTFSRYAVRSTWVALTRKYDVLVATTTPLTAAVPGILARWLRGKPFVFEVRDLWPELPRAMGVISNPVVLWTMDLLEWVSYRSAHRLIGLSPGIVDGITRRGVPPNKVTLVPNGCDLGIFGAGMEPWRPETVRESDLQVVFAGTHGVANGLDAVLDAALELKRRGRDDIKLVLVGQGKIKSGLVARARAEDLDNVVFCDPVSKLRLAGLMAASDIGLQILADVPAFYYGTSPNKFFDYIAAGLPVLSNYPGWLADLTKQQGCGYVVPPGDPSAFADALEQAAGNPRELEQMSQRASALARERFSRAHLATQWVSVLESVQPGVAAPAVH